MSMAEAHTYAASQFHAANLLKRDVVDNYADEMSMTFDLGEMKTFEGPPTPEGAACQGLRWGEHLGRALNCILAGGTEAEIQACIDDSHDLYCSDSDNCPE